MESEVVKKAVAESMAIFEQLVLLVPSVLVGILFIVITFFLASPISRFVRYQTERVSKSLLLSNVAGRLVKLLIWAFGFYVFLKLVGLSNFALTILSSAGVAGIIIGFAFKDIAENFISSLLLSIQKPFKIHDIIEVDGVIGVVQKVTSRATTLVDFDGDNIQIPNAIVYKSKIRNITANPRGRVMFDIGIGYDSSIREAQKIALEQLAKNEYVLQDPEPLVLVDNLGSATINLKVSFWIDVSKNSPLKLKSVAIRTILRALEGANISMPDDARERIHLNAWGEDEKVSSSATKAESEDQSHLEQDLKGKEDVTSENKDIEKQARLSDSPEKGKNIL